MPEPVDPLGVPPQPVAADTTASEYIARELRVAERSLMRTRLTALIATIVVLLYMGWLTIGLHNYLRPTTAAHTVTGLIDERVQDQAEVLATQVRDQIPTMIAKLPDYALAQLPSYRSSFENRFETELQSACASTAPKVEQNLDQYLTEHKDQIKTVLDGGKDPAAVKTLTDGLTQDFLAALKEPVAGGESVQDKLDASLQALQAVQKKMDRLANATDLTPEEKKTRHAIAVMANQINKNVPKAGIVQPATSTPTGTL
jgi:hypothetical protein